MASAAISAGASLLGGIAGGKGAKKAAKIQAQAYQQGIAEQQREFGVVQANNAPYMAAGTQGLASLMTLLGLGSGGAAGEQSAIDALKLSPTFTSLMGNGEDAILANAAATGGLRGGNTQDALSRLGVDTLSSLIQSRIANLGNLTQIGQSAASGTNTAALSTGNNISDLLGKQGSANGTAAAAPYAAFQQVMAGLGNAASGLSGGGGSGGWNGNGAFPAAAYGW